MHNTELQKLDEFILMEISEADDADLLSSHGSQSPPRVNAYSSLFAALVQLCLLNWKNEIE